MRSSPYQSPLHQGGGTPSPPRQPSSTVSSSRASPQQTKSIGGETALKTALGLPLRSLLRETEAPIPPPPISPPPQSESVSKSPPRDGAVVITNLGSLPEDAGSPIPQLETSPERPAVANRMAAAAAPMEAKVRGGVGKGMRVETRVVEWAELRRAGLGLRLLEVVFCLISFSVMAADKTRGWAGDSFDRYQEFRYCITMNIIAFVYASYQVCAQLHHMIKMRPIIDRPLSYYLDFFIDQVLAYLMISASSSAAARNDDWISMFGNDSFTDRINGSIAMSFLAFFAFAFSSIVSAYKLFSWSP